MSKQDDANFLKIQTCILKVHIHCDGCKQKVKKLLQKIDGVYTVTVDAEQGKVNVSGNVDPNILIKKLSKSGKHAELISPKINSNPKTAAAKQTNNNVKPQNQKGGNVINGGGGVKDQKAQTQMKGLNKDVKVPQLPVQKDPKSVKFALPPEDEDSEFDDEFDEKEEEEEDDLDDMDGFDDDFGDNIKNLKTKPANNGNNAMKSGGNQKKAEVPVQVKGINGNTSKKGGADDGGGGKNGKGNIKSAPNGKNNVGQPQMAPVGPPQMGQMGPAQMGNMLPQAAVQGLPAGAVVTPGYFQGQVAAPNPYQQQQYMQAMQQQRMMMMNGQDQMHPMMGYPKPPPYAMYMQPPPQNVQYADYFCEENPSSCSIM